MPKLTIEFGGLCLFVQRETPGNKGLVVLMPRDRMHGHQPQIVEKQTTFQVLSGSFDLTDLEGGKKKLPIENAVRGTKLTGGRVPRRFFDPVLSNLVAARFFLPYPKSVRPHVNQVQVRTVGQTTPHPHPVAGIIYLEYDFSDTITIGRLTIPANANATVSLANIMSPVTTQTDSHPPGSPLKHSALYYNLIDGFTEPPPALETAARYDAKSVTWIDPVECTVWTACAEGETNCGDD